MTAWADPPPFYVQRALALLGRTVDGDRVQDVLAVAASVLPSEDDRNGKSWAIAGHGRAGVIAAYAAILESRFAEVGLVDPPVTHRDGPILLNVLRVLDIPEALGLLAPRPVRVYTGRPEAFERTASIHRAAGGVFEARPLP